MPYKTGSNLSSNRLTPQTAMSKMNYMCFTRFRSGWSGSVGPEYVRLQALDGLHES